nr:unnamed protein product [Digitaria exilis]
MPLPRGAPLPPSTAAKVHLELALLILSPLPSGPPRLKLHAHSHLRCLRRHGSRRVAVARPPPWIGAACVPFGLRPPPAGPTLLWTTISRRSSRQHSPSTETWAQRSPPSWSREPTPHIGSPQIKLSFAAPALCIHLVCCEDSAAVESSGAQATQLGDAFPVVICDCKAASQRVDQLNIAVKSELQRDRQIKELAKDLRIVEMALGSLV